MSALRRLASRLRASLRRKQFDAEFDEEMRSHLDLAVDDFVERGLSPEEATRLARAKFGLAGASRDAHRRAGSVLWLNAMAFDVGQAWRSVRRDRGHALVTVSMLTVALALSTTVFAAMDAMLFRGFPLVERSDRVVFIQERDQSGAGRTSYADVQEWRSHAASFTGFAFSAGRAITFRDGRGRPNDMRIWQISPNTFSLLGVRPHLGRDFDAADGQPGAPQVLILNHRFWRSRFAGRDDVIGSTVHVNDLPATVVGVMPERFDFPLKIDGDFWMPMVEAEVMKSGASAGFGVIGRMRDGVELREARAQLETINRRLEIERPDTNRGVVPTVATHAQMNSGPDAAMIWGSLWAASILVLIIAAVNLANLSLVRTIGRSTELATKLALGAGHLRIVRQLIVEQSGVGAVAALLAWWITVRAVAAWDTVTASQYQVLDYAVGSRALLHLSTATVLAVILMAAPSIDRLRRARGANELSGQGRGVTMTASTRRLGSALVAVQVALAMVLLCGAGVLLRSFTAIVNADSGVRAPELVLSGLMRMPSATYGDPAVRGRYVQQLEAALRAVPGVDRVTLASTTPVRFAAARPIEAEGQPSQQTEPGVGVIRAGTEYFEVLGLSLVAGRAFSADDRTSSTQVAIVNQSFVDRFWPGQDPIGRRIRTLNPPGDWRVIVGVAPNVLQSDPLRQTFKPLAYVPVSQGPAGLTAYWMARTTVTPSAVAAAVRAAVQSVDPDVTLSNFLTLRESFAFDHDFMDAEHSELGKHARVAPVFAVVAVVLSGVGLIAVIGCSVRQRTKEIGIRMAVGATATDVRRLILKEGLIPVSLGVAAGLSLSIAANQLLRSQLVGVSPNDPLVMFAAPALLIAVALAASQLPARRAMLVDPVVALRAD